VSGSAPLACPGPFRIPLETSLAPSAYLRPGTGDATLSLTGDSGTTLVIAPMPAQRLGGFLAAPDPGGCRCVPMEG